MPRGSGASSNTAARIVRAIWQNPRISRIGIAEKLGLDKSTVTYQVSRLMKMGLIEETDEGSSGTRGGRKPIYLAMNRSYGRVIGIEIKVGSYVAVAVNLAGETLAEARGGFEEGWSDSAASLLKVIRAAIKELCPDRRKLLGVGVGLSGLVDQRKGRLRYSVPMEIESPIDFAACVAAKLPVPCYVENDANCCAWGELAFSRGEPLRDFLFALVEYRRDSKSLGLSGGIGVGFGIVLGGRVHSGAHGSAGEFRSAFCDGRGALQLSLPKDVLSRLDSDAEALAKASDELARNIAMLGNTMDFERIYIGGDIEGLKADFPELLRRRLEENWMYPFPKDVDIRCSSLGDRAVAYGAASMVLERLMTERSLLARETAEGSSERALL